MLNMLREMIKEEEEEKTLTQQLLANTVNAANMIA